MMGTVPDVEGEGASILESGLAAVDLKKKDTTTTTELSDEDKFLAVEPLRITGKFPEVTPVIVSKLQETGAVLWEDSINKDRVAEALAVLREFADHIKEVYSYGVPSEDALEDVDMELYGIERLPNVGNGKHNAHFDAYDSRCHDALVTLAEEGNWLAVMSELYPDNEWSLFDTAISITRPLRGEVPGEGLDWHTDGAEGTTTVLMSMEDVEPAQGCLEFAPASHLLYDEFHSDPDKALASPEGSQRALYAYRACQPLIVDSRMWHRALDNNSDKFRFVAMYYYTSR